MGVDIMVGDALTRLKEIPDNTINCTITSPPYLGMRSYNQEEGMIGLEDSIEEHIENLMAVFDEVRRVMTPDGIMFMNYGEMYAGSSPHRAHHANPGLSKTAERNGDVKKRITPSYKSKDLIMMPALLAMELQSRGIDMGAVRLLERTMKMITDRHYGDPPCDSIEVLKELIEEHTAAKKDSWWLRSKIIWEKSNSKPESVRDRPTNVIEDIYMLSKSAKYFYDYAAVYTTSNMRNVWNIPTKGFPGSHFAVFPEELVRRCLKMGASKRGVCDNCKMQWYRDIEKSESSHESKIVTKGWIQNCECDSFIVPATVLDPFAGAGTVGLVAQEMGFDSVLIEISPEYADMARKRIEGKMPLLSNVRVYETNGTYTDN